MEGKEQLQCYKVHKFPFQLLKKKNSANLSPFLISTMTSMSFLLIFVLGSVLSRELSVKSYAQLVEIFKSHSLDYVVDKDLRNLSSYVAQISDYSEQKLPERVVHTTGTGARGHFELTHDITSLSNACLFKSHGKKVPILGRFSMGSPGRNKPDSGSDSRGLAVRFFTECGNWDVLSASLVFFFNDVLSYAPDFLYSLRAGDFARVWDLRASHPESVYRAVTQFSYLGTPTSYRRMDTSAGHTFKLVSATGAETYARFHFISEQGARYNNISIARQLFKKNPKRAQKDLRDAIARGEFPSWKLMIQTMPVDYNVTFDPFDSTFVWPREGFRFQPVGRIVFTENIKDYEQQVEAVAFNPGNLISGIEPSKDRLFPYRVFAYDQLHRNRLGPNYREKFPVNRHGRDFNTLQVVASAVKNELKDGAKAECIFRQLAGFYRARAVEEQKQIAQLAALALADVPGKVKERLVTATYDKVDAALGSAVRSAQAGAHAKGEFGY